MQASHPCLRSASGAWWVRSMVDSGHTPSGSEAPVVGIRRNRVMGDHRFDVDKYPARAQRREQPVPTDVAEHPVRYGEDQPVELGKMFERHQIDGVFAFGFGRV